MPVAFLTGLAVEEEREDVFGWVKADQKISVKKLVYIGLRDVDRGEKEILRDHGIKAFSMHDIDKYALPRSRDFFVSHAVTHIEAGTVSGESWKWRWVILEPIPRFICPSTWTLWIPNGHPAPARLYEEG